MSQSRNRWISRGSVVAAAPDEETKDETHLDNGQHDVPWLPSANVLLDDVSALGRVDSLDDVVALHWGGEGVDGRDADGEEDEEGEDGLHVDDCDRSKSEWFI